MLTSRLHLFEPTVVAQSVGFPRPGFIIHSPLVGVTPPGQVVVSSAGNVHVACGFCPPLTDLTPPSIAPQTPPVITLVAPFTLHSSPVRCTGISLTTEGSHVNSIIGVAVHSPLLNVKPGILHACSEPCSL